MKQRKNMTMLLLAIAALFFGLVAINNQTAEAKSYTIPKSVRGSWYAFNMSKYTYSKVHITAHGEYHAGHYYKQRGKAKATKLHGTKYYKIWTSVNPYYVRASKGNFLGKKRAVLWVNSQGTVTAYFHSKIPLTYQWLQ